LFTIKKFILLVLILFTYVCNAGAVNVSATSAILMEQNTRKPLCFKNQYQQMKPASTTKILTAITALENSSPDEIVTVSQNAANAEGSSMYIEADEKLKMRDLLFGLMMNSGNDAAVAIAEHISGSEEEFAKLMNKTAKKCGAKHSNFVNANGLDDDKHYTTAYDLALIAAYAMENPQFRELVKTKTKVVETTEGTKKYLKNHNRLLSEYEGCDGVKTGFTKASGRTLVSSASKDGMRLIGVTLNAPNDWNDHKNMFNYGFSTFDLITLLNKDNDCCTTYVSNGVKSYVSLFPERTVTYAVKKEEADLYTVEFELNKINAPVSQGDILGNAVIKYNGKEKERINLLSDEMVEKIVIRKTYPQLMNVFFKLFLNNPVL